MSTAVIEDTMMMPAAELLVFAKCDCCGLMEECTQAYMNNIRQTYHGNWFCGLCGEAVKDEIARTKGLISTEEAVARHMNFCRKSMCPDSPPAVLVDAMRQILRRHVESPRSLLRSTPNSPSKGRKSLRLSRSESCMLTLALESESYTNLEEL
ncbi:uncharacterized protein LOC143591784 [Bidens hawaiensis]|uniref:uncharacterized protein LOC143591784 n=1 Tax=Bidens hawaiensis TaxID=980011 RepID=UPI00404AE79A